eukprot:gb/GECG01015840.1/.p1 GENE.gb/GECG01015840.1/~~gb/GECG01015840.1/.p1  ORF type:complete len:650 (+),score=76.25 gb/GECG01015840.1/:1-1950(+)
MTWATTTHIGENMNRQKNGNQVNTVATGQLMSYPPRSPAMHGYHEPAAFPRWGIPPGGNHQPRPMHTMMPNMAMQWSAQALSAEQTPAHNTDTAGNPYDGHFGGQGGTASSGGFPCRLQSFIMRLIYHWLSNGIHHGPSTKQVLENTLYTKDSECLVWFQQCTSRGLINTMEWKEILTRFLADSTHWELLLPVNRRNQWIRIDQQLLNGVSHYRCSTISQGLQYQLDAVAACTFQQRGTTSQPVHSSTAPPAPYTYDVSSGMNNSLQSAADTMVTMRAAGDRSVAGAPTRANRAAVETPKEEPARTQIAEPSSNKDNSRRDQSQIFVATTLRMIEENRTPPQLLLNLDECVFHLHSRRGKQPDGSAKLETKSLTVTPVITASGEIIATQSFIQPESTFEEPPISTEQPHLSNHRWIYSRSGPEKFSQTTATLQQLLTDGVLPYVREQMEHHPMAKKAVLIISCSPTRISAEFRNWMDKHCGLIKLSFVPPKTASLCQPLHRYVFRKLKLDIRMSISEYDYQVWKDATEMEADEKAQGAYLDQELSFNKYLQKLFSSWMPTSLENLVAEDLTRGFKEVARDAFPFLPGFYESTGELIDENALESERSQQIEEKAQSTLDFAAEVLQKRDKARRVAAQPRSQGRGRKRALS